MLLLANGAKCERFCVTCPVSLSRQTDRHIYLQDLDVGKKQLFFAVLSA